MSVTNYYEKVNKHDDENWYNGRNIPKKSLHRHIYKQNHVRFIILIAKNRRFRIHVYERVNIIRCVLHTMYMYILRISEYLTAL